MVERSRVAAVVLVYSDVIKSRGTLFLGIPEGIGLLAQLVHAIRHLLVYSCPGLTWTPKVVKIRAQPLFRCLRQPLVRPCANMCA